jgi:hypothetical protein
MPFDNPHQTPFGDLELLMEARGRISSRDTWVRGHFRKGGRYCLVASLSLTCGSRSFGMPNRTERRLSRLIAMQMPSSAPFWVRHRFMPARQRLIAFNDDPLTRHGDVLALLDRTIDHLARAAPFQHDRIERRLARSVASGRTANETQNNYGPTALPP